MEPGEPTRRAVESLAESLVGLGREPDQDARFARLCAILRDEEFLPDPMLHEAILAVAGKLLQPDSWLLQKASEEHELRLRDAIEDFAADFFAIPLTPRIERWKGLIQACSGKASLLQRLLALNPGLKVETPGLDDPSPAVNELIRDLLAIFPMRQGVRAAEIRARAEQFREDPRFTPAERARAVKQIQRKHGQIAALVPSYFEILAKPKAIRQFPRWRLRISRPSPSKSDYRPLLTLIIVCPLLVSWLLRTDNSQRSGGELARSRSSSTRPNLVRSDQERQADRSFVAAGLLRADFKRAIRSGLSRRGKQLEARQLNLIVERLPIEELLRTSGRDDIKSSSYWTEPVWVRFIEKMKIGLLELDSTLNESELNELVRACFSPSEPLSTSPTRTSP